MEGDDGGGEGAGEGVAVEEEGLEVLERGEVGDGAGEGVVVEAEDAELVEAGEGVGREGATEGEGLEDEADDAALGALDALPLAVVEALVEGVEELVVEVGLGFEGQEGDGVGGWEEEVWRRRWEWKGSGGVDGGGEEEEEEEEEEGNHGGWWVMERRGRK